MPVRWIPQQLPWTITNADNHSVASDSLWDNFSTLSCAQVVDAVLKNIKIYPSITKYERCKERLAMLMVEFD